MTIKRKRKNKILNIRSYNFHYQKTGKKDSNMDKTYIDK